MCLMEKMMAEQAHLKREYAEMKREHADMKEKLSVIDFRMKLQSELLVVKKPNIGRSTHWTPTEKTKFNEAMSQYKDSDKGEGMYKFVSKYMGTRTPEQVKAHIKYYKSQEKEQEKEDEPDDQELIATAEAEGKRVSAVRAGMVIKKQCEAHKRQRHSDDDDDDNTVLDE